MSTLDYYEQEAGRFFEGTVHVDFSEIQDRFSSMLTPGARILDLGCGSGRDTKIFLEQGFDVDATDGSEEICALASKYTGIPVKKMLFSELEAIDVYDGIWACASILHVPKTELPDVFRRIVRALKKEGVFYTSFKYGDFEGVRNGRFFSNYDEDSIGTLLEQFPELSVHSMWVTGDVRPGRGDERWLNMLLIKK